MTNSETITVFLYDGDANGRIKASIENWTGVGYKIPRDKLDDCASIEHLNQSSVYFLFGSSGNGVNPVYIGQAGNRKNGKGILARLKEHSLNPGKDYWTDAIVFTTKDNSLGPTELNYLENHFFQMAIKASRYEVKNQNDPNPGNISEEKESALKKFTAYTKLILGVFGYKVFSPLSSYEKEMQAADVIRVKEEKRCPETSDFGNLDAAILEKGGKASSVYLRGHLIGIGYIGEDCYFTIAKLNNDGSGRFWANPSIDCLNKEWVLVLNDNINRELHFFKIPAKSISNSEVRTRDKKASSGKTCTQLDIEIIIKDNKYVCKSSNIEYQNWYVESANY